MARLTKADRIERAEYLQGRPNYVTGGFNVNVTNGVGDTSWVAVPQEVGERVLSMLLAELRQG